MRKISNILLLIGGIYSIVCAVGFFITAIVFFVSGTPLLAHYLEPLLKEAGVDDPDRIVLLIQISAIASGATFLYCAILCIPSAILSFAARKNPSKGLLLANAIIGYLCGTTYNVVGGILGLIYNHKLERRNAQQAKVVDAQ